MLKTIAFLVIVVTSVQSFPLGTDKLELSLLGGQNSIEELLDQNVLKSISRQIEHGRADAGEYLDQVLEMLRQQMVENGLTEVTLPDLESKFSKKILGVTFHGSASLKKGWIRGLETITRTGPASLDFDSDGSILVEAKVGVHEASIQYDMTAKFMGLGPSATVRGKLSELEVIVRLRVNVVDFTVVLDKFDVKNTGKLTTYVDGLGAVFDFVVEIIINLVGNTVKRIVMELLEGTIKNLLNDIIQDFLFPSTAVAAIRDAQQNILQSINYYQQPNQLHS